MSDLQAITDRVEIEALRGEFTDAAMIRDYDRLASLFTPDGAVRMPHIGAEAVSREEIRAGIGRLQGLWDYFVQTPTQAPSSSRATPRPAAPTSRARALPRRQLTPELRHLPRPLPAHRRRLEVHRARLRGQIPRHNPAGGLGAPGSARAYARIMTGPELKDLTTSFPLGATKHDNRDQAQRADR